MVGGSKFSSTYNYDTLRQSKCTSVNIPEDKSNYWAPSVYYKHRNNGTLELVPSELGVYYLHRGTEMNKRQFPPGLRMIAGSATRGAMGDTSADKAIRYQCRGINDPTKEESYAFPKRSCPDGIFQVIFFPSCWNGKDVTSANHQDHVSYPIGTPDGGTCPPTHPIRFITMKLEQAVHTERFEYYDGAFFLSTGDNEGYSSHGDFANGWDASENSLLQRAINSCTDSRDDIKKCLLLFTTINPDYRLCRPESKIPVEDVGIYGGLKQLPGDNALWGGDVKKVLTGVSNNPPYGSPYSTLPSNWVYHACMNGGGPSAFSIIRINIHFMGL